MAKNIRAAITTADLANELSSWIARDKMTRKVLSRGIAEREAARDASDPHTYNRVFSHLMNNTTTPECYTNARKV